MTNIAVVILNYNGKDLLRKFLPHVVKFSEDAAIIVADNGSSDGSSDMIRNEFPAIQIIQIGANLGFCGGYNFALEQITANYYVLLNSDVEVTSGWLAPMVHLLDSDSTVAAVQPKILAYDQKDSFEYAGAAGGFIDALGYPFCRGRIFDTVEKDIGQYDDTRPVFWATGACFTIRAKDFHEMGGFDTDFFAHMEEIDLCWKLNRAGRQVFYVGQSYVYHVGGGTLSRVNATKTYLNFRNGLFLILKNVKPTSLLWKLPLRLAADWLAMFFFLMKGELANAGAVLKAHVHFFGSFGKISKKRKLMMEKGYAVNAAVVYPKSILLSYFGAGLKAFTKLDF